MKKLTTLFLFCLLSLTACVDVDLEGHDMTNWGDFSGNMGRSANVPISTVVTNLTEENPEGDWKTVMELRTPDDIGETFTVTLSAPNFPNPSLLPAADRFQPQYLCRIEWGAGGTNEKAVIDWLEGTTFTISGSFIRVSALYIFSGVTPPTQFASVKLGAFVGFGSISHNIPPQRTLVGIETLTGVIAPAGTSHVIIPSYASRFSMYGTRGAGAAILPQGDLTMAFIQFVGFANPLVTGVYQIGVNTPVIDWPLNNFSKLIRFTNDDAVEDASFTVIYHMSL